MIPKATYMQLCVYDWYKSSGQGTLVIPQEQGAIGATLAEIVRNLQEKHGNKLKIEVAYCDVNDTANQLIVAREGITTFPAIGIAGEYSDGTQAGFWLEKKENKPLKGISFDLETLASYTRAILYKEIGENTIFCKAVKFFGAPQLCNWEKWIWMGAGALAFNSAVTTDNPGKRVGYGTGAAVCFWRFYKLGGVEDIQQLFIKNK